MTAICAPARDNGPDCADRQFTGDLPGKDALLEASRTRRHLSPEPLFHRQGQPPVMASTLRAKIYYAHVWFMAPYPVAAMILAAPLLYCAFAADHRLGGSDRSSPSASSCTCWRSWRRISCSISSMRFLRSPASRPKSSSLQSGQLRWHLVGTSLGAAARGAGHLAWPFIPYFLAAELRHPTPEDEEDADDDHHQDGDGAGHEDDDDLYRAALTLLGLADGFTRDALDAA